MPCTVDYPKLTLTHPVLPSQSPLPALDPVSGNGNKEASTISRRPWLRYLGVFGVILVISRIILVKPSFRF